MANFIEVYRKNSLTINCTVSGLDDLEGFVAKLMVKKKLSDTDENKLFELTGTIVDLLITFEATAINNTQIPGVYYYEIYLSDDTLIYSVVKDTYTIIEVVRN